MHAWCHALPTLPFIESNLNFSCAHTCMIPILTAITSCLFWVHNCVLAQKQMVASIIRPMPLIDHKRLHARKKWWNRYRQSHGSHACNHLINVYTDWNYNTSGWLTGNYRHAIIAFISIILLSFLGCLLIRRHELTMWNCGHGSIIIYALSIG